LRQKFWHPCKKSQYDVSLEKTLSKKGYRKPNKKFYFVTRKIDNWQSQAKSVTILYVDIFWYSIFPPLSSSPRRRLILIFVMFLKIKNNAWFNQQHTHTITETAEAEKIHIYRAHFFENEKRKENIWNHKKYTKTKEKIYKIRLKKNSPQKLSFLLFFLSLSIYIYIYK